MLGLAEAAAAAVRSFLGQRNDLIMVVEAADNDMPAALKTIEGVDYEIGFAWCWIFSFPFETDAAHYAKKIVAEIATSHAAVDAKLRADGGAGWPALPARLKDETVSPADRLRLAVRILRALAPQKPGSVTVFGLLPSRIVNGAAYEDLVAKLTTHEFPLPWCAGVRFLLRDDRARPWLTTLAGPRTRRLPLDFSPDALQAAARAESSDPALPAERRANAALIAAGMDQSHGRLDAASAGYRAVLAHAGPAGNASLAAVAACGLANCFEQQGDVAAAERILLAALEACLQTTPPPFSIMLNLFQALVMLVARQHRWMEAEAHLTAVAWMAEILVMPQSLIEALDRRGMAQWRQKRTPHAEKSWRRAIEVADQAGEIDIADLIRGRLAGLLQRTDRAAEAAEIMAQRRSAAA